MALKFRSTEYIALAFGAASGSLVFGALPVAVGVAVSVFGGTRAGGVAASMELGAMGVASVIMGNKLPALRARSTSIVSAVLLILGHAVSAVAAAEAHWLGFLVARALVGIGEGGLYTICSAFAAKSPRPHRTFTGIAFVQTAVIGVFFTTMQVVNSNYDPVRVFEVFATFSAIIALPLLWSPRQRVTDDPDDEPGTVKKPFTPMVRQVLAGFGVYSAALFLLFPYVEAIGLVNGFTHAQIAAILGASALASLLGPTIAAVIGLRFGRLIPALIAVAFQVAAGLILVYSTNLLLWGGAELSSITMIYLLNPLMFGLLAQIEPSGRANAVATAIMSLTAVIGPGLSVTIMAYASNYEALGWCNAIAYLVMVAILWGPQLAMDREARRSPPRA